MADDRQTQLLERLESMKGELNPRQRALLDRAKVLVTDTALPRPAGPALSQGAAPAAVPALKEPPSLLHTAEVGATGFNEGFARTMGMPVDIVNAGLQSLGMPEVDTPFMGSKFIERYLMPQGEEPQNAKERIVKRAGEEVGATVPFAALTVAAQAAKVAENGTRFITGVMQDLKAMDPLKLAAVEEALAASGGAMAGTMKELFPKAGMWADFVGELIGTIGPTATLGLIRTVRAGKDMLLNKVGMKTEEQMKQELGKKLGSLGREEKLEQGIDQAEAIKADIPGFSPTTGQVSNEPGLIQAERSFERSSAKATQEAKTRKQDSQTAVRDFVDEGAPTGKLGDVSKGVQQELDRRSVLMSQTVARKEAELNTQRGVVSEATAKVIRETEQQMKQADQRVADRLDVLGPKLTDQQAGAIVREEYRKEMDKSQAVLDQKWAGIDRTIPLPASNTQAAVRAVTKELRTQEADEFVPKGALADLGGLGVQEIVSRAHPLAKAKTIRVEGPTTFGELDAARRRLQGEIRAAANDTVKRRLQILLEGVEKDLDQLADNPDIRSVYPDQATRYDEVRAESFKHIQRFKSGEADKLRQLDKTGRFKTVDEDATDLFLKGHSSLEDFTNAVGSVPRARMALEEAAKLDFFERAVEPGTRKVNVKAAEKWIAQHEPVLTQFPDLKLNVRSTIETQKIADDIIAKGKATLKNPEEMARISDPATFNKLDRLEREHARITKIVTKTQAEWERSYASDFLGKDATRAADSIVNSRTPATAVESVMNVIGKDEAAVRGFQREMWEAALAKFESKAIDAAGRPILQARNMREFIAENKDWMEPLFGRERMARLTKAQEAMEMLERTGRQVLPGGPDTAVNLQSTLSDLGPFLSRLYAERRGIVSIQWIVGERAARALGKHFQKVTNEQAEALLMEAFFDPKVAQTLMLAAQDANDALVKQRLKLHLYNMNHTQDEE